MLQKMKQNTFMLIIILAFALAMSGCMGGGSDDPQPTSAPYPTASTGPNPGSSAAWNFLVYMDGDNNLESASVSDFKEMMSANVPSNVNVLVLWDRKNGGSSPSFTDTRLYKISNGNYTLIKDMGELNMGNLDTLQNFLVTCQRNYPAQKTALTLWDHGAGVWPKSVGISKGVCFDDTSGSTACLTTDEVAAALKNVKSQTGRKVDVVHMDTCLTQMLEIAYEWRGSGSNLSTDYLVGSEETVPGPGNDYRAILNGINSSTSSYALACNMVQAYYNYYHSDDEDTTSSAIDLGTKFDSFMNSFKAFATAMSKTSDTSNVMAAAKKAVAFEYKENKDLYSLAGKIASATRDSNLKSAASTLQSAISNIVIKCQNTGKYVSSAHGTAILFPTTSDQWGNYSSKYPTLRLPKETGWTNAIRNFMR